MKTNANDAYHAARELAARHIRQVEKILAAHAERQAKAPHDWGYTGDMNDIAKQLGNLVEAFAGSKGEAR